MYTFRTGTIQTVAAPVPSIKFNQETREGCGCICDLFRGPEENSWKGSGCDPAGQLLQWSLGAWSVSESVPESGGVRGSVPGGYPGPLGRVSPEYPKSVQRVSGTVFRDTLGPKGPERHL